MFDYPNNAQIELGGGLIIRPNQCHRQADNNRLSAAYRHLGLKMVVGSVGVGLGNDPIYIYGNPDWTREAQQFYTEDGWLNAHVWLEDNKNGVYDVQLPYWQYVANAGMKKYTEKMRLGDKEHYRLIEGKSKNELRQQGLHYILCPRHLQKEILDAFFSWKIQIIQN